MADMINPIDLMRVLQGDATQQQFAVLLDIRQSTLSRIYAGHIKPGRDLIAALVRTFPDKRQLILDSFFAPEYTHSDANTHVRIEARAEAPQ